MKRPWFDPPFQPPLRLAGEGFVLRPPGVRDVAANVRERLEAPVGAAFRSLLAGFPLRRIASPGGELPWSAWSDAR